MGVIRWNFYYEISNRKMEFGQWTLIECEIDNWKWTMENEEIVNYRQHTVYFKSDLMTHFVSILHQDVM